MSTSLCLIKRFPRPLLNPRTQTRALSLTPSVPRSYPRKNAQDRESINTEATEYTKSGTDDGAAKQEEAAFDPRQTRPEQEKNTAGEGTEVRTNSFPFTLLVFDEMLSFAFW